MVACHEHQRSKDDCLGLSCLELLHGILEGRIALDGRYVVVGMVFCFQHIVYFAVDGRCRSGGSVADEEHVLALPGVGGDAVGEDVHHMQGVIGAVHQRRSDADVLEKRPDALHVATQRFHFQAVDDVGALHDEVGETVCPQTQHGLQGCLFADASGLQTAQDDARRIALAHFKLRECGACLVVDGINGLRPRVVVGRSEVHHQQRRFFVLAQMGQQVVVDKRRKFLRMDTHAQEHQ